MEQYNPSPHSCFRSYLIPTFSYSCGFIFDVKLVDGFLTCVQMMVLFLQECADISKETKIYTMADDTYGLDMAIQDMNTKMSSKLNFTSNFIMSLHYASTFKYECFLLRFSYFLFLVHKLLCISTKFPNAFHLSA